MEASRLQRFLFADVSFKQWGKIFPHHPRRGTPSIERHDAGQLLRRTKRIQTHLTFLQDKEYDWSKSVDFIYRHHVMPRSQLFVPQASFFTNPLKYNDVTRANSTRFRQCCRAHTTDDCWTIDGAITLSDDWVVRTRFQLLRPRALATVVKQRFGTVHDLNPLARSMLKTCHRNKSITIFSCGTAHSPKYSLPVETEGSVTFPLDDEKLKKHIRSLSTVRDACSPWNDLHPF